MSDPFARVPLWILGRSDVSWPAKIVYGLLARYVGKGRTAWPSVDQLAADMRTSRRNVERWLKELRAAGVLDIERTGRANTYRLLGGPPEAPPEDGRIDVPDTSEVADQIRQDRRNGSASDDGSDPPRLADQIRQDQRIVGPDTSFCEEKIEQITEERAPAAPPPTAVERVAELRSKEERRLGGVESGPIAEAERQLKVAVDLLEDGYSKRYAAARGGEVWPVDHDARMASRRAVQSCARWALSRGLEHLEERAKKLLDGMFADARLTEASWPWAWVARDPARYAVPPAPPVRAGGKRSDFIEPVTDYSDVPTGPIGMAAKGAG